MYAKKLAFVKSLSYFIVYSIAMFLPILVIKSAGIIMQTVPIFVEAIHYTYNNYNVYAYNMYISLVIVIWSLLLPYISEVPSETFNINVTSLSQR